MPSRELNTISENNYLALKDTSKTVSLINEVLCPSADEIKNFSLFLPEYILVLFSNFCTYHGQGTLITISQNQIGISTDHLISFQSFCINSHAIFPFTNTSL